VSQPAPVAVEEFHLARARSLAVLGRAAPVAGVGVLAVVACSALLPTGAARTVALSVAWTVAVIGLLLTGVAAVRTARPPVLVRVDAAGMRVRVLRGAGPRRIAWADVRSVRREPLSPGWCVVVELGDGRRSVVPEGLVDEGGAGLVRVLRARLDAAHGQRRL